jgi:hypothetical protein
MKITSYNHHCEGSLPSQPLWSSNQSIPGSFRAFSLIQSTFTFFVKVGTTKSAAQLFCLRLHEFPAAYDANTLRMTQYSAALRGGTISGTMTWNPNGSLKTFVVADPFNALVGKVIPGTQFIAGLDSDFI